MSNSPAESPTSRHVRAVIDGLALYDEDELTMDDAEESWDWEFCDESFGHGSNQVAIPAETQHARGFHEEGAGPPEVSAEELSCRDAETMQTNLIDYVPWMSLEMLALM